MNVNVQCCHVGYEYNNDTGQCLFTYSEQNDVILRQDSVKHTYIYIQVNSIIITAYHNLLYFHAKNFALKISYIKNIMNHDSGFIIGIAVEFLKILIEQSPKTSLRKQTHA